MNEQEAEEIKLQELEHFEERKKKIEEELKSTIPRDHVIFTIPGIGEVTGSLIVARVGDFSRFPTKKFVAYCGLDLNTERSDPRVISHEACEKYLRKVFYLAVLANTFES